MPFGREQLKEPPREKQEDRNDQGECDDKVRGTSVEFGQIPCLADRILPVRPHPETETTDHERERVGRMQERRGWPKDRPEPQPAPD